MQRRNEWNLPEMSGLVSGKWDLKTIARENANAKPGPGPKLDLKRMAMARMRGCGNGDGVDGGSLAKVREICECKAWREWERFWECKGAKSENLSGKAKKKK